MFITHAQSLPDYGSHYYIATVDCKELQKLIAQQRKGKKDNVDNSCGVSSSSSLDSTENAHRREKRTRECSSYSNVGTSRLNPRENAPMIPYSEDYAKPNVIYDNPKSKLSRNDTCNNNKNKNNNNSSNNNINGNNNRNSKDKRKTESNVWLAIHAQGLKLFERGGEPRERTELAQFQWRDVHTLSYNKNCLVVYSKLNGKRCKFKLRMDHRK